MFGAVVLALVLARARGEFEHYQLAGCNTDCGRVEVRSDGGPWRVVASSEWGLAEAGVVCRSLGFDQAVSATSNFNGGSGGRPAATRDVRCRGNETSLNECAVDECAGGDCASLRAVGLSCRGAVARDAASVQGASDLIASWADVNAARAAAVAAAFPRAADACTGADQCAAEDAGFDGVGAALPPGAAYWLAPFTRKSLHAAYVFADELEPLWRELRARAASALAGAGAVAALGRLRAAGALTAGPLGLVLDEPSPLAREAFLSSSAPASETERPATSPHNDFHYEFDAASKWAGAANVGGDASAQRIFDDLSRDGIAHISDFGLGAAALAQLNDEARAAISSTDSRGVSVTSDGAVTTARVPLLTLERTVLADASLGRAVAAYLGGSATVDGYKTTLLRTTTAADEAVYMAGRWHHDRVGRRLKLFIFLHDVDCAQGHPTVVARGTHALQYYRTDSFLTSRFKDAFVTENYNLTSGCGKAGGGFLFDTRTAAPATPAGKPGPASTALQSREGRAGDSSLPPQAGECRRPPLFRHTIHRGTTEGSQERLTVIVEFHNPRKCAVLDAAGFGLPCPSGDQFLIDRPVPTVDAVGTERA